MINLTIHARDGYLYELTSRYSQPQSSAAQRYTNDIYLTERTIAYLSIEPETWLQILARINCRPTALYSYHAASVHKEVANAMMRGDLILYKLPLLNANNSLRGSKDIGLCIIKGPKLHCATHLSPVPIASKQTAQMLLTDLGIGTNALLSYLNSHNLYNSYNQSNPLDEVLNRLASKELLAYQIQLPPMSVPEKKFELVAATGPGYDPVPLGPESSSPSAVSTKSTGPTTSHNASQPAQSLEECEQRLVTARERLITDGYQSKYSDTQLKDLAQKGELDDRFVVRVIESKYAGDSGYLGQNKDGEVKYWSTTFNQMENADTDPKTLCGLIGINYDPDNSYTLVVVDTHARGAGQSATIVPTHKNLGNFAKSEIKGVNPDIIDQIMTPEYNEFYAKLMQDFKADGKSIDKEKDIIDYANENFSNKEDKACFKTRMKINSRLGANEHYTGNGTTKNLIPGCPNKCGVMETFTYDKNPLTLSKLETSGSAIRIATKPL